MQQNEANAKTKGKVNTGGMDDIINRFFAYKYEGEVRIRGSEYDPRNTTRIYKQSLTL